MSARISVFEEQLSSKKIKFIGLNTIIAKRRTTLVQAGSQFSFIGIVKRGTIRCYTVVDGREVVLQFFKEGDYICDCSSFFMQQPTNFYFEVLEKAEIELLMYPDWQVMLKTDLNRAYELQQALLLQQTAKLHERSSLLMIDSAASRYAKFEEGNMDLMLRVQHYMVASYLGMTPETMSRIRRKLFMDRKERRQNREQAA